jgi:hypothetical protein
MNKLFTGIVILFLFSCAPSRFVKPLGKNEAALGATLGGPLIGFAGTTIPIPLSSVTGAYGIRDNLTVFGSLHTTSLLFKTVQVDAGAVKELLSQKSFVPGISVSPSLNAAVDFEGRFKAWPALDFNAYWNYSGKQSFFYVGASSWFELSTVRSGGEPRKQLWLFNPHLGHTFAHSRWQYTLEGKWLVPGIERLPNAVDYKGFGSTGAIGIYLGVTRNF